MLNSSLICDRETTGNGVSAATSADGSCECRKGELGPTSEVRKQSLAGHVTGYLPLQTLHYQYGGRSVRYNHRVNHVKRTWLPSMFWSTFYLSICQKGLET